MFLYSLYTRVQTAFARPATVAFACALPSWLPRHMRAHEVISPLMAVLRDNIVCQGLERLLLLLEERIRL